MVRLVCLPPEHRNSTLNSPKAGPLDNWYNAEARFSLRRVLARIVGHVLLPTCLLELAAVWFLAPSWGPIVTSPFLVLPALSILLLTTTGGTATHWKECEACIRNGKVFVRLPAKDFFVLTPSRARLLYDGKLEIAGSGSTVKIDLQGDLPKA